MNGKQPQTSRWRACLHHVSHVDPRFFETITLPLQFQRSHFLSGHQPYRQLRTHARIEQCSHTVRIVSAEFSNTPEAVAAEEDKSRAGARHPPPELGSFRAYSARD